METSHYITLQFHKVCLAFLIVLALVVMMCGTHALRSVMFPLYMTSYHYSVPLYPICTFNLKCYLVWYYYVFSFCLYLLVMS